MGRWKFVIHASLRRLTCPAHGACVEQVPFARHRSGFTRDFEDVVAYLATKTDKAAITRILSMEQSVYSVLARERDRLFPDEKFADLFSDRGAAVSHCSWS